MRHHPGHHWTEHRTLRNRESLSWDIAHHLSVSYDRKAVIIAADPQALLAAVSKQWQKAIRQVSRQRSSTLDASKIHELTKQLAAMQAVRMSAKPPGKARSETIDVHFMTLGDALAAPPVCQTLYVTVMLDPSQLGEVSSQMEEGTLIVTY